MIDIDNLDFSKLMFACPGWPKGAHEHRVLFPDGSLGGVIPAGTLTSDGACETCLARMYADLDGLTTTAAA